MTAERARFELARAYSAQEVSNLPQWTSYATSPRIFQIITDPLSVSHNHSPDFFDTGSLKYIGRRTQGGAGGEDIVK